MTAPEECNDCGEPAYAHVYTGTVFLKGKAHRTYTWMCWACARDAEYEREWSLRDD